MGRLTISLLQIFYWACFETYSQNSGWRSTVNRWQRQHLIICYRGPESVIFSDSGGNKNITVCRRRCPQLKWQNIASRNNLFIVRSQFVMATRLPRVCTLSWRMYSIRYRSEAELSRRIGNVSRPPTVTNWCSVAEGSRRCSKWWIDSATTTGFVVRLRQRLNRVSSSVVTVVAASTPCVQCVPIKSERLLFSLKIVLKRVPITLVSSALSTTHQIAHK